MTTSELYIYIDDLTEDLAEVKVLYKHDFVNKSFTKLRAIEKRLSALISEVDKKVLEI